MKDNFRFPAGAPIRCKAHSSHRILVVDNDSDVRQLSVDVLAHSSYDVKAVSDGAAGWQALQAGRYDLIITDNALPGMSGMDMMEKLHTARMTLPVILAARHLPAREMARKPWLKPAATLPRPFSIDDLLAAVRKVLRKDNHAAALAPSCVITGEPAADTAGKLNSLRP